MPRKPLFSAGPASDPLYIAVRAADNDWARGARKHCESLWLEYEPHADKNFTTNIRCQFHKTYWEMYLAMSLKRQGYDIYCPKPGPDVGIKTNGRRIWFEATAATRGDAADRVEAIEDGDGWVPNEKIVLRYTNSIVGKMGEQRSRWLGEGIVADTDSYLVALNTNLIDFDRLDTSPPRILQALLPLGSLYVSFDANTGRMVETGYQRRVGITKTSGTTVPTALFFRDEYRTLSGVLCSRAGIERYGDQLGDDFQLVPNPCAATNALPPDFRLKGIFFRIELSDGRYQAHREHIA